MHVFSCDKRERTGIQGYKTEMHFSYESHWVPVKSLNISEALAPVSVQYIVGIGRQPID